MSDYDITLKFIIVGEASVGKTVLTKRYIQDEFLADSLPTIGNDYFKLEKVIDKYKILIQFWDTAGQERYKSISTKIYEDARAIMIVYDITNRATFDKIEDWQKGVLNKCQKNATFILVGNKIDLETERQVSTEEGRDKAKLLGMLFIETSAKTNINASVNSAFDQVIEVVSKDLIKDEENDREVNRDSMMKSIVKIDADNDDAGSKRCC